MTTRDWRQEIGRSLITEDFRMLHIKLANGALREIKIDCITKHHNFDITGC